MAPSLLEQIEAIKADPKLSPEEKKKQVKRLRRKARRTGEVPSPKKEKAEQAQVEAKISTENLIVACRTHYKDLPEYDPRKEKGYAFSLRQATKLGISDPEAFRKKFIERWGFKPKRWAIIPSGWDPLFLLGPIGDIEAVV